MDYKVPVKIESAQKYRCYLERVAFNFSGTKDNIADHFSYYDILTQVRKAIPLSGYPFVDGLRIKTLISELGGIAEVLMFDALVNLDVSDKWKGKFKLKLDPKRMGFILLLELSEHYGVIPKSLVSRLHKLFSLRNMIHLTDMRRVYKEFDDMKLRDSQATVETLIRHFFTHRYRPISGPALTAKDICFPW